MGSESIETYVSDDEPNEDNTLSEESSTTQGHRSGSGYIPTIEQSMSAFRPKRLAELQIFYNLAQFHLAFAFATMYIGMAFSNWNVALPGITTAPTG